MTRDAERETFAVEAFDLRLQRGRVLRGRLLAVTCAARNVLLGFAVSSWEDDFVAPAWVIVTDRLTGSPVGRVPAGREPFAAEALITAMRDDLLELTPQAFLERHRVR